jgi:hypothetical protein
MFHAQKREWMGCAIATAAMLTDHEYEEVMASSPLKPAQLRQVQDLQDLLAKLTNTRWKQPLFWWSRPISRFRLPDWPVALFLEDRLWNPRFGQWIAVNRELIHDPEFKSACLLKHYSRKDWYVKRVLQPAKPTSFVNERSQRRIAAALRDLDQAIRSTSQ